MPRKEEEEEAEDDSTARESVSSRTPSSPPDPLEGPARFAPTDPCLAPSAAAPSGAGGSAERHVGTGSIGTSPALSQLPLAPPPVPTAAATSDGSAASNASAARSASELFDEDIPQPPEPPDATSSSGGEVPDRFERQQLSDTDAGPRRMCGCSDPAPFAPRTRIEAEEIRKSPASPAHAAAMAAVPKLQLLLPSCSVSNFSCSESPIPAAALIASLCSSQEPPHALLR